MSSFKTLTVRSTDKPRVRVKAIQNSSDPRLDAQGFIVNINIINTGANLYYTWYHSTIIYCNLNVKHLFYDHREYILPTK